MSWVAVAVGGGAVANMISENEREKNLKRYNEGQAEMTRYSPWTGVQGQIQQDTGPGLFGAGLSGAMGGLSMGQAVKGMGKDPNTLTTTDKGMWSANEAIGPYDQYRKNRFGNMA